MHHVAHAAHGEGDAAVLVGVDGVGDADVVVVAVVAVGSGAGARGLMAFRPVVQSAELIFGHAGLIVGAASEGVEAVGLLRVEPAEGEKVEVLETLYEEVVVGGSLHGEIAEVLCLGSGQTAGGCGAVAHEAGVHQDVVSRLIVFGVHDGECDARIEVVVAGALHIGPIVAVGIGSHGGASAVAVHFAEVHIHRAVYGLSVHCQRCHHGPRRQ